MFGRHLDDAFDAADGRVEQRADALLVVHAVSVSHAHEDEVSRKAGEEAVCGGGGARLQLCEENNASWRRRCQRLPGIHESRARTYL